MVRFRYRFLPTSVPGVEWWWAEKGKELKLTDAKDGGQLLATVSGTMIICEQNLGLPEGIVDEIVVSAVAAMVKKGKDKEGLEAAGELVGALAGT